jgi:hypothetical protein
VNIAGNVVGVNRPDLQYNLGGTHIVREYDTTVRGLVHYTVIKYNDPDANVSLVPVTSIQRKR